MNNCASVISSRDKAKVLVSTTHVAAATDEKDRIKLAQCTTLFRHDDTESHVHNAILASLGFLASCLLLPRNLGQKSTRRANIKCLVHCHAIFANKVVSVRTDA